MPTANRRKLLPLALASFLSQDWPEKELIVIDDGTDRVEDLCAGLDGVRYVHTNENAQRIGTKLNIACELARGDVLVRFDDDDWSATNRISEQVTRLEDGVDVVGYNCMLFWDELHRQASRYTNINPYYAMGTSLCFTREYWQGNHFICSSYAEDNEFIEKAKRARRVNSVDAEQLMVARIHGSNTSNRTGPLAWPLVEVSEIPQTFFDALSASKQARV